MTDRQDWTYYRYGFPGEPATYYRRRHDGVTEGLKRVPLSWIERNDDYLSRYIENGEAGLDVTTRDAIESELGLRLPF